MKARLLAAVLAVSAMCAAQDTASRGRQAALLTFAPPIERAPRPDRMLPDAPSHYALSNRQKFELFQREARSPMLFVASGLRAGIQTRPGNMYGTGAQGFARNYAVALSRRETNAFFGRFVFPALLNQDPRYHPSRSNGLVDRSAYAASRVLLTRSDQGKTVINTSYLLGALVSSMVASSYRAPGHRGPGDTAADFGATVGCDAGMNLVREFWPQLRTKLKPITPKPFRKLVTGGTEAQDLK
ncbi:MAG TPA: hypothetical protein VEG32_12160 [Clostridia bacterium]|nr:hypothetical protein [Clostridia bacterium]